LILKILKKEGRVFSREKKKSFLRRKIAEALPRKKKEKKKNSGEGKGQPTAGSTVFFRNGWRSTECKKKGGGRLACTTDRGEEISFEKEEPTRAF